MNALVHRWFVQYNPLYFASALCVLGGILLIAVELPPDAFSSKLGLAGATEAYQALLLTGAFLLLRAGQKRPAALLGLAAFLFALDAAMNGERLISHVGVLSLEPGMRARKAVPASLALAVLGPLKLWILARLFRLRGAGPALAVAGAVLALLPLLPYLLEAAGPEAVRRQAAHLAVFWLGAPLLGWGFSGAARRWGSELAEGGSAEIRVRRIAAAAPFLVAGAFVFHGIAWSPELAMTPSHFAPHVLALICGMACRVARVSVRSAEVLAWSGAGSALVFSTLSFREAGLWPLAALALAAGPALVAVGRIGRLRLLLPATVCVFGGAWLASIGAPAEIPLPPAGWPLALAAALLAAALWQRDLRCLFASALAAGASIPALEPAAALAPFGIVLSGLWLAGAGWLLFPEERGWLPFLSGFVVLALGGVLVWADPAGLSAFYAANAACSVGLGILQRRLEYTAAGGSAFAALIGATRRSWVPETLGGWGFALVAAGFALLAAGVALNLALARRRATAAPAE